MDMIHIYRKCASKADGISQVINEIVSSQATTVTVCSHVKRDHLKKNVKLYVFHGCYSVKMLVEMMLVSLFSNAKIAWCPHGSLQQRTLSNSKLKKLLYHSTVSRLKYMVADFILFVSDEEMDNSSWLVSRKCRVIYNGLNALDQKPEGDRYGLVYIGRIDLYHKGLDRIEELLRTNSKRLKLYGPANKISDILSKQYHFMGPVYGSEKIQTLTQAKFFCMFSRYEGLPMGAIEALRSGCILVVTPECNLSSVIAKYNCGISSNCGREIEEFIDKVEKDHALALQLSENSTKAFEENFNVSQTIDRYRELYAG